MKNALLIVTFLFGLATYAQCGCGQQLPKPPKTLALPDTGGQSIDKHKKLDVYDTGGVKLPQDKKRDWVDIGGRGQSIDVGKKLDVTVLEIGGIKLPPDGKKKDFAVTTDTGGQGQSIDVGKKKDICFTTATKEAKHNASGGTTLSTGTGSPGKRQDFVADTGGVITADKGTKKVDATSDSGGGTLGTAGGGMGKKMDFA